MRLVDADAMDWAFTSLRWRDGELLHWGDRPNWLLVGEEVEKLIADAPTIDAIPVEWFKNRRDIYLKAYHAGHESELHVATILNDTLKAWQKEQEAHGT